MRLNKLVVLLGATVCFASQANAGIVGWFKVPDDAVAGAMEDGRVLQIAEARFYAITSKAKVGDRIELDGVEYEAVVVVPRQVLTVVDKATRTEMRVLIKAPSKVPDHKK